MEHLLLLYFKDKPALIHAWHKLKLVLMNVIILGAICISILAKTETVRSFSLGLAAGIVLINLGETISKLRSVDDSNKSVNG